jgi:hypothetical protein
LFIVVSPNDYFFSPRLHHISQPVLARESVQTGLQGVEKAEFEPSSRSGNFAEGALLL